MLSGISSFTSLYSAPVSSGQGESANKNVFNPNDLTEEEQKVLEDMKARDREVRAHEQAHKTVGGPYAGAISYQTETGPDGREYATDGEVQIDVSAVPDNPDATIRKMDTVIQAALAVPEPSSQDKAVASQARVTRNEAVAEKREMEKQEQDGQSSSLSIFRKATEAYETTFSQSITFSMQAVQSSQSVVV